MGIGGLDLESLRSESEPALTAAAAVLAVAPIPIEDNDQIDTTTRRLVGFPGGHREYFLEQISSH